MPTERTLQLRVGDIGFAASGVGLSAAYHFELGQLLG